MWVRDVHSEGIEPHPGPSTISKNIDGLATRFNEVMHKTQQRHKRDPILAPTFTPRITCGPHPPEGGGGPPSARGRHPCDEAGFDAPPPHSTHPVHGKPIRHLQQKSRTGKAATPAELTQAHVV